jgi:hypothetical protein
LTQLIQITKTSDLLKAKPINEQIIKFGRNEVNIQISNSVFKCAIGLNIELTNFQSQILIEDIVDKYKYDSIEDIQQCLKNGRRGDYGKTYGKFNMEVISGWMSKHLEAKGDARDGNENASQHKWKDREEYEHSIKVGTKINKEIVQSKKNSKRDARAYDEFKQQYNQDIKDKGVNPGGLIPDEK